MDVSNIFGYIYSGCRKDEAVLERGWSNYQSASSRNLAKQQPHGVTFLRGDRKLMKTMEDFDVAKTGVSHVNSISRAYEVLGAAK